MAGALIVTASGCAAHLFVPPTGAGRPAPEAPGAWTAATAACRDVRNASGTLRVTLRQGRFGSPGLTVSVIVTADGRVWLDDGAVFYLAGTAARAQLLLRQDRRLVTARADEIVDALVGVKLGPERLLAILSGCVTTAPLSARPEAAAAFGARLEIPAGDSRMYLQQRDARWRVVAGQADGMVVEYRAFQGDWPRAWRAGSPSTTSSPVVLDVLVEDLDVNVPAIPDRAFQLNLPADATPMTLEELRTWRRNGGGR